MRSAITYHALRESSYGKPEMGSVPCYHRRLEQLLKLALLDFHPYVHTHTHAVYHGDGEKGNRDVRAID